jgi:hypothetical protein
LDDAAAVVVPLSCGAAVEKRVNRGKKGVTSNGIFSRADVIATG